MHSFCRPALFVSLFLFACATAGGDAADGGITITPDAPPFGTPDATQSGPCVLVPQSGCQGGQACDLDFNAANGDTLCRAVTANGNESSTCTAASQCAAGYACLGSGGGASSCLRYCNVDGDCTAPGGLCLITITNIPGVTLCTQNCSPINSSGCPSGFGCHTYTDTAMRNLTACDPAGASGQGATCTTSADCAVNHSCVNTNPNLVCLQNCIVPGGSCAVGSCVGYTTPAIIGGVEYGVCF